MKDDDGWLGWMEVRVHTAGKSLRVTFKRQLKRHNVAATSHSWSLSYCTQNTQGHHGYLFCLPVHNAARGFPTRMIQSRDTPFWLETLMESSFFFFFFRVRYDGCVD